MRYLLYTRVLLCAVGGAVPLLSVCQLVFVSFGRTLLRRILYFVIMINVQPPARGATGRRNETHRDTAVPTERVLGQNLSRTGEKAPKHGGVHL